MTSVGKNSSHAQAKGPAAAVTKMQEECFIIMPISDHSDYEVGHFDSVYKDIFIPACEKAGYVAKRADNSKQTNLIHLDILKSVVHAPMAICDLSSRNPNVLFELGLRQAFDKPTIIVKDAETDEIFDISPLRYTVYRRNMKYREVLEDQERIRDALISTQESVHKSDVNSLIRLLELSEPAKLTEGKTADPGEYFQVLMAELAALKEEMRILRRPLTGRFIGSSTAQGGLASLMGAPAQATPTDALGSFKKESERVLNRFVEGDLDGLEKDVQLVSRFGADALTYARRYAPESEIRDIETRVETLREVRYELLKNKPS